MKPIVCGWSESSNTYGTDEEFADIDDCPPGETVLLIVLSMRLSE